MIFDTHTHSYFFELADRQDAVVAEMTRNNVHYATQIGCDVKTSQQAVELAKQYDPYYAAVGYHPTDGQTLSEKAVQEASMAIEQLLLANREHIVAIGEIGFDYHHLEPGMEDEQKETQRILFLAMTELARKHNLPIVIHTRDAR